MKTQFEKIYVLSLITNKDRQKFIKYQFNKLGLDFEFIYGVDYYNFSNIQYPDVYKNTGVNFSYSQNLAKNYGCAMTHYQAVLQAYYLGYNNVLIFEDDVCMNTNMSLLKDMLNNIPEDADFVTFDFRQDEDNEKKHIQYINDNKDKKYVLTNAGYFSGGAMYAIMNRKSMKLYLDNQHKNIVMSDWVKDFWTVSSLKKYIPTKCLCICQPYYKKIFINNDNKFIPYNDNLFFRLGKYSKIDFFEPKNFQEYTRL